MSDLFELNPSGQDTPLRGQASKETASDIALQPVPWKVGDELGGFRLDKFLGSGSSGCVYRVHDTVTDRNLALKLLRPGDSTMQMRNRRGFRHMMMVEHPNLLRVDRIHQLGNTTALAMEEVSGMTFNAALKKLNQLPKQEAIKRLLDLLRDFSKGLAAMHSLGLVHRDIKPANLMVDDNGRGRVIDFGLVDKYELEEITLDPSGFLLGTPRYLAPEVIWSQKYLPAGDIFALGIVMLESLNTLAGSTHESHDRNDGESGFPRSKSSSIDADVILEVLEDLSPFIPQIIRDACAEMLDRYPSERPTAMRLSRLGLPPSLSPPKALNPPVVGRRKEIAEVIRWIDSIFSGKSSRLHITGPSGIGKTCLLEDAIQYIESKHWGQVFRGRCRLREDAPLQAFSEICDGIADRYMRGDREKLVLDSVSAEMLYSVFPVLKNVIEIRSGLIPPRNKSDRLDALEAAARLSEQLRSIGPLFIVMDDSQWADRDSLNVLDRLQSAVGDIGLGIITVSRQKKDPQRLPAAVTIPLKPLSTDDSVEILARAAQQNAIECSSESLHRLAAIVGGCPFRLHELGDEFRPGGILSDADGFDESAKSWFNDMSQFWQRRVQRLSDEAKALLPYIVTAGGRMSSHQLGELTAAGESIDAAISELVKHRLVNDVVSGIESISIFHDHVSDELVKTLSESTKCQAHHEWASLLVRQDNPKSLAARIAGHFFAAGEPGRAVSYAILAAEEADRVWAKTEAGRWHARVIDHVDGEEKVNRIRQAAKCFREADFPIEAAKHYELLAQYVDEDERIDCQLNAIVMLIRSGRFALVRGRLADLTRLLGLPRPKSPLNARMSLLYGALRLRLQSERKLDLSKRRHQPPPNDLKNQQTVNRRDRQRFALCVALIRPMSMFDNLFAAELSVAASRNIKLGTPFEQIHILIGESVFGCYDKGEKRRVCEQQLVALEPHVESLGDHRASGDWWAAIAYSHGLAMRWKDAKEPVHRAIEHYEQVQVSHGFEKAHTRWFELWTDFYLGQWSSLVQVSETLVADGLHRNDLFQRLVVTGGHGSVAWLVRDSVDELKRMQAENLAAFNESDQVEFLHIFQWVSEILCSIYEGDFNIAWKQFKSIEIQLRKRPFSSVQLFRVFHRSLGALIALHQYRQHQDHTWIFRIRLFTTQLRGEHNDFACVMANFYEGLLQCRLAKQSGSGQDIERALDLLGRARTGARGAGVLPFDLAASDALASLQNQRVDLLADQMGNDGVVCPEKLLRLYTVSH